ncbi:adenosylcobinamide-GDP ribazoletransferase [Halomicronema hongdechloris]
MLSPRSDHASSSTLRRLPRWLAKGIAALAFYTCLPVPGHWSLEFTGIARWAPGVGLFLGGLVSLMEWGLAGLGVPTLTRSGLLVAAWLGITGGLHLDGAMDTADGLAVPDPQRRLAVMADSRTGAFGVMAAIILLGLKTAALVDLTTGQWLAVMAAAGWGRWGQVVAIARYPYLREQGKGALHKAAIRPAQDVWPGLLSLLGLSLLFWGLYPQQWLLAVGIALGGNAIAILTGAWFHRQLGGHTGDTYGAVVEWTEAFVLCLATILQ